MMKIHGKHMKMCQKVRRIHQKNIIGKILPLKKTGVMVKTKNSFILLYVLFFILCYTEWYIFAFLLVMMEHRCGHRF